MPKPTEGVEVVFDPVTKSAILRRGGKVTLLAGPFRNYHEAKKAAAIEVEKEDGDRETDVY